MREKTLNRMKKALNGVFTEEQINALLNVIEDAVDSELAEHMSDYEHQYKEKGSCWV